MGRQETPHRGIPAVVELAVQLERSGRESPEQLRERDRAIGRDLADLQDSPRGQVLAWAALTGEREDRVLGKGIARALRIGSALLVLGGLLLGWAASAAVFTYDGSRPVNVVHVLAVFVAVQGLLLLLLLLTLAPRPLLAWIPGMSPLLETLEMLRPGRLQKLASRYLPRPFRERSASLLASSRAHEALFGAVEKWLAVASSQSFAVAFNVGALLGSLYLVFFSDLAFAWSSTLQVSESDVHLATSVLSAPWKGIFPGAVPSFDLVEATRYYRLGEGIFPPGEGVASPDLLGGWWPFLVMSMICYGLLPRLALWVFASWRLGRAVDRTILHLPGTKDLLERMNSRLVETQARETEATGEPAPAAVGDGGGEPSRGGPDVMVNWADLPLDERALSSLASRTFGRAPGEVLAAGGARSLTEDRRTIERISDLGEGGVAVSVKAWEPPLEDVLDFLGDLRRALPQDAPVVVVPVGAVRQGRWSRPTDAQAEVWKTALHSLGDPWITLRLPREEGP